MGLSIVCVSSVLIAEIKKIIKDSEIMKYVSRVHSSRMEFS